MELALFRPGKLIQNGIVERIIRTFREDVLDCYAFENLEEMCHMTPDCSLATTSSGLTSPLATPTRHRTWWQNLSRPILQTGLNKRGVTIKIQGGYVLDLPEDSLADRLVQLMESTALVTGVAGPDGTHLAEFLIRKSRTVHGIRRRAPLFRTFAQLVEEMKDADLGEIELRADAFRRSSLH